jgi:cell division protein FtsQ
MPRVTARPPRRAESRRSESRLSEPRSSVRDRPSRWALLLRRQRRLLRPAAWGVAGFAVVLAGTVLLHAAKPGGSIARLRTDLAGEVDMRVQDIVIQGRSSTPEPLLRNALGISKGQPILGFSIDAARQRIEALSWVEHATVERRLPGTIVVALTERRPFAIWQHDGKFVLIDRAGQVVANETVADFGNLPLVVGLGAPEHAADLLDALARQPDLQSRVIAAVRVGERRWNLRLNTGADVLLPEGAADAAIARLMELQTQHALLDRPLAVVDMRLPDRMVLRPAAPAAPAAPTPANPKRPT